MNLIQFILLFFSFQFVIGCIPQADFVTFSDAENNSTDVIYLPDDSGSNCSENYNYTDDQFFSGKVNIQDFYLLENSNYYQLIIKLNRLTEHQANVIDNPDRLYVDLFGATIEPSQRMLEHKNGLIKTIRTGQFNPTTARIVIDVTEKVAYQISPKPKTNEVIVSFYSKQIPKSQIVIQDEMSPISLASVNHQFENSFNHSISETSPTLAQELGIKVKTIIIDPGHGGKDPGAVSPHGIMEKDITLDIAHKLKNLLERDGSYNVLLTRENDVFIPLEQRTAFANQHEGDLFISIHVNAHTYSDRDGIETYYLSLSDDDESRAVAAYENRTASSQFSNLEELLNKILNKSKIDESVNFAEIVQRNLIDKTRQQDRGVKRAGFVVLIGAKMPSILTEVGFLTNPKDEKLLKNSYYHKFVAQALYSGIKEYSTQLFVSSAD